MYFIERLEPSVCYHEEVITSGSHWQLVAVRVPLGSVGGARVDGGIGTLAGVRLGLLVELRQRVSVVIMVLLLVRVL